jgi:hypothetical protein
MPDQPISFEHALQTDIERLAEEIKSQREKPDMKSATEKELVKEAIRTFPQLEKKPPAAPVPPPPAAGTNPQSPLPGYAQNAPAEVKLEIEYLLNVALQEGLGKALSEAQKSPYFVQDALHDALAGRLYPELKKRGVVK